jgi:hypothetical protein
MEHVGIFYGQLVHFVVIWYILPILVCCTKINLATLQAWLLRAAAEGIKTSQVLGSNLARLE